VRRTLALALVVSASVAHADDRKHTLADLKALVGQQAFLEAFLHLGDIAPAQRTAEWVEVAAAASAGMLATLPSDDGTTLAMIWLGMIDTIDRDYPQLRKSAKYTSARASLGLEGLAGCYRSRGECARAATRFVEGGDRSLALEAAKLTVDHGDPISAIAMFKRAVDPAKALCQAKQLPRAVVAGIGRPATSQPAADARDLMTTCWDAVKTAVAAAFDQASKGSTVHDNTCEVLKAKRMLSALQTKRCK
jgi:hypothetical protein